MKKAMTTKRSKELYAAIALFFLTVVILTLLLLNIDKNTTINLNTAEINAVDDRAVKGSSIANAVRTNQGVEFSCQIINSYVEQPYCELHIDLQDLNKQAPFTGLDLSSYEHIGFWIQHNHPTQPGTRIELLNFNPDYSVVDNIKSLKHNSLEYLEAYVTNPIWLKMNNFSIPQWWNNSHNLSLTNGGTDFSNIYTIVISPSLSVQEGSYKLSIERIELRGKYIATTTLVSILIALWSVALGYIIRRSMPPQQNQIETPIQVKETLKFGSMSDPVSGALNRIGLRKCFDQLSPTDSKNLCLIFLNVDHYQKIDSQYSQQIVHEILKKFVSEIDDSCRSSDIVVRWDTEEFLLICPDTKLSQAVEVAAKIRNTIQDSQWPNSIELTCSSGVAQMYDDDLNDLISRANKALYSVKNTGSNSTAAA